MIRRAAVAATRTVALVGALGGCTVIFDLDDPRPPDAALTGTATITWARPDGRTTSGSRTSRRRRS